MLLQMALFHSFLYLSNIPMYINIYHLEAQDLEVSGRSASSTPTFFSSICHEVMRLDAMILVFFSFLFLFFFEF